MTKLESLDLKEWEKKVPLGICRAFSKLEGSTSSDALKGIERYDLEPMTSLSRTREIARKYSKRHKVPIKLDEEKFDNHPYSDGFHSYRGGKSYIYLHPILQYYPESYIKGVIEHELDHRKVELKWESTL